MSVEAQIKEINKTLKEMNENLTLINSNLSNLAHIDDNIREIMIILKKT